MKHKFSCNSSAAASLVNEAGKAQEKDLFRNELPSAKCSCFSDSLASLIYRIFSSSFFDKVNEINALQNLFLDLKT